MWDHKSTDTIKDQWVSSWAICSFIYTVEDETDYSGFLRGVLTWGWLSQWCFCVCLGVANLIKNL